MFHTISDSHGDRLSNVNSSLHKYLYLSQGPPQHNKGQKLIYCNVSALLLNSTIGIVVFINVAGAECCFYCNLE